MILIAPDKFKGTFSAEEIARVISEKVAVKFPREERKLFPMADGGEGTAGIVALRRDLSPFVCDGIGPSGEDCGWKYYAGERTGAIDSSAVIGRAAIDGSKSYSPLDASSYPLGRLVSQLIDGGMKEIFIGVGGTMTTDGGSGFLQGLGFRFYDREGRLCTHMTPRRLSGISRIEPTTLPADIHITGLVDVDVPLVAAPPALSALSFAIQKGVRESELPMLAEALSHWGKVTSPLSRTGHFHGAGGGLGFALSLLDNTRLLAGAETLLGNQIETLHPDRIYTGEGCFDRQSFGGKVTGTIIRKAMALGIPVTIVCGRCTLSHAEIPEGSEVILLRDL